MDKSTLKKALQALDKQVVNHYRIIIVGGAAMIMHFGASRATRDIDAILEGDNLREIKQAAQKVAEEFNLDADWLNDSVKGFAVTLPPDFHKRITKLQLDLNNIEVYVLGIAEQLIMKIVALREQDLEDIEVLLPKLTDEDKTIVIKNMNHVSKFRPDWAQKIQYFLEELQWKIN